ncbi:hypothetical protein BGZ70_000305 [Mortierella alpina]|uniref:Uncharacterized protein n=1 Tax=Mortierella alpina TaxID=64518 RepID=A0A9P6IYA3_MORAP|nr:hypothetical protein BGZ70_000305 [Mortierella alpina]
MTLKATLLALVATLTLLIAMTEAHSWADCVDWRPNNPNKPGWGAKDGKCFGYARQYPVNSKRRFGDLDSDSPNRHYQQNPKDFTSCSDGRAGREPGAKENYQKQLSKSYGGKFGNMATAVPGQRMCVRWPAKNHAVKDEKDRGVFINMPKKPTTGDLKQSVLMKNTLAKLPYKNCNPIKGDTDHTPCGGCFNLPKDIGPGRYMFQWRWELNPNEWYTSCWDVQVNASKNKSNSNNSTEPAPKKTFATLGDDTNVFSELA